MLVKLLPDQVSRQWETISYAIENALPPTITSNPEVMNNILMSIMEGKLVCWASFEKVNGSNEEIVLNGIVTTMFAEDLISRVKNLYVYTIYALGDTNKDIWTGGLKTLIKYGRANGCKSIIGYTEVQSLIEFIKRMGGETNFTFVSIPLW